MVSEDKKTLFVTSNGGQTWISTPLPSSLFDESQDLYISEVSPDHMILAAGTEVLTYYYIILRCFFLLCVGEILNSVGKL